MENADTQARIDAFQDESWEKLSIRANNILKVVECDTPAKFKAFVESDFTCGHLILHLPGFELFH